MLMFLGKQCVAFLGLFYKPHVTSFTVALRATELN